MDSIVSASRAACGLSADLVGHSTLGLGGRGGGEGGKDSAVDDERGAAIAKPDERLFLA